MLVAPTSVVAFVIVILDNCVSVVFNSVPKLGGLGGLIFTFVVLCFLLGGILSVDFLFPLWRGRNGAF